MARRRCGACQASPARSSYQALGSKARSGLSGCTATCKEGAPLCSRPRGAPWRARRRPPAPAHGAAPPPRAPPASAARRPCAADDAPPISPEQGLCPNVGPQSSDCACQHDVALPAYKTKGHVCSACRHAGPAMYKRHAQASSGARLQPLLLSLAQRNWYWVRVSSAGAHRRAPRCA